MNIKSCTINAHETKSAIIGHIKPDVLNGLRKEISFLQEGYFFTPQYKNGIWDGRVHFLKGNKFPTGLLHRVKEFLLLEGIDVKIIDKRNFPSVAKIPMLEPPYKLRKYQLAASAKMIKEKCGLVKIPTRGGKTIIAAAVIKAFDLPTLFIVHTGTLLKQARQDFENYTGWNVGEIGGGKREIGKITVATVQTLSNLMKTDKTLFNRLVKDVRIYITDEAHHLKSGKKSQWYNTQEKFINAGIRFGLTATPPTNKTILLLEAATGPVIVDIPLTTLQQYEFVTDSEINFLKITTPNDIENHNYRDAYKYGIQQNFERLNKGVEILVEAINAKKVCLAYVDFIDHGEELYRELRARGFTKEIELLHGKKDKDFIIKTKDAASNRNIYCIIVTRKLFGEGVTIPSVDVIVNFAGGKSSTVFTQMLGRGLGLDAGKDKLYYYDFFDDTNEYLRAHSRARIRQCGKLGQKHVVHD